MRYAIGVGLALALAICVFDASVLVGALLAVVRGDHRNPVTGWFVGWYTHHHDQTGAGG